MCMLVQLKDHTQGIVYIRDVYADATFNCTNSYWNFLHTAEGEKQHKYLLGCQDQLATFISTIFSVDGRLGFEA